MTYVVTLFSSAILRKSHKFFIAYQTPDENWNSNIDVEIDGQIVEAADAVEFRTRNICVVGAILEAAPPPALWERISGPWEGERKRLSHIAVHPNNPQVIYAVVRHYTVWGIHRGDKLYKSTNSGASWHPINKGLPGPFWLRYYQPITAIAIAPSNPDIIYIGTSSSRPRALVTTRGKGVFKSTDGGLRWTAVDGPRTEDGIHISISSIIVHPTNPDIVFVGTFRGGIWRTTTGGGAWERVSHRRGDGVRKVNTLAINPANPDIIYAAAYNFESHFLPLLHALGLFITPDYFIKSEEGGDIGTWQELSLGGRLRTPRITDIATDSNHSDIVYVVTGGGQVYKSSDRGRHWWGHRGRVNLFSPSPLPNVREMEHGRYIQPLKVKVRPIPIGCRTRRKVIAIHPDFSEVIYLARSRMYFMYKPLPGGVCFSPDAGKNWFATELRQCIEDLIFVSDEHSRILYAAGPRGLFKIDLTKGQMVIDHDSPGELRVYDSEGRVTGLVDGVVKTEIPYSVFDEENKIVTILSPTDTYRFQVAGVEEGEFGLTIALIRDKNIAPFTVAEISTSPGVIHQYTIDWDILAQGDRGATVQIDADGDGIFEEKTELQLPRPSFTYFPVSPTVGQTITFDASDSYDPDGHIISYRWDFGDGVVERGKTTSHSFVSPGDYRVTLSVTDNDGVVNTSSKIVMVTGEVGVEPAPVLVTIASTAPNPTNVSPIPMTVTFSEPVTDFVAADITVTNGIVTGGSLATADDGLTFTFTVTAATDAAQNTGTATATIVLDTRPFAFSLAVEPSAAAVPQGDNITATVTATLGTGIAENITLAAELPAGVAGITVAFVPSLSEPTFASLMTITTAADATLGVHPITITGTGAGGLVETTIFTLTVVELVTVSLPEVSVRVGEKGRVVPVSVDEAEGIVGFELTVTFNPALIQARDAQVGELTSGWWVVSTIDNEKGQIEVAAFGYPALPPGRGSIVNLIFDVVGNLGENTALTFTHGKLIDGEVAEIPSRTEDGSLTIVDILQGDINDSGDVDISDVILCLRMALGMDVTIEEETHSPPYPEWLIGRADRNADGEVNISDVILVLRKALGLDT